MISHPAPLSLGPVALNVPKYLDPEILDIFDHHAMQARADAGLGHFGKRKAELRIVHELDNDLVRRQAAFRRIAAVREKPVAVDFGRCLKGFEKGFDLSSAAGPSAFALNENQTL
jgi:hypothetical protein